MKVYYTLFLTATLFAGILNAQIEQITNINASGGSSIGYPHLYQGAIYFEADDGSNIGDELYRIKSDKSVELFKNINQDPDDTSPNSDPRNFIELNGLLYFNANDGDKTGHDKELWVTDGTAQNTKMIYDIWPSTNKGGNPQEMFVFNKALYFQANDGGSSQWWKYAGSGNPEKITELANGGYSTPQHPVIDTANNRVYFKANATDRKANLYILKADDKVDTLDFNETGHFFSGNSIMFNEELIFEGNDGSSGYELWKTDGTKEGTKLVKNINTADAKGADIDDFILYGNKVFFVADKGTGEQLWATDGTGENTVMVAEPFSGNDGDISDLFVYNNKLYFAATDGTNGKEIWVYDGENSKMLKDINVSGDGSPKGFAEVDGLMFFEADDDKGNRLWVTDGTEENTVPVASVFTDTTDPVNVNSSEFIVNGTELYFTADDAEGDEFFVVDAKNIFTYQVTFNITDGTKPVEGATISFNDEEITANENGEARFYYVRAGTGLKYSVTKDGYLKASGSLDLVDQNKVEAVVMTLGQTVQNVSFEITDGMSALEGASVTFNGSTQVTGSNGKTVFSDVKSAKDLAYSISLDGYQDTTGTIDVDKEDLTLKVSMKKQVSALSKYTAPKVKVYPNPTRGLLTLDGISGNATYTVFDMNQKTVGAGPVIGNKLRIDAGPGVYFLHIQEDGKVSIERIMVN